MRKLSLKKNFVVRNLLYAFFNSGGLIKTTEGRSKYLIREIDQVINVAKKNNLTARRRLLSLFYNNKKITNKILLMVENSYFQKKKSGYVSRKRIGFRASDGALLNLFFFSFYNSKHVLEE